MTAFLKTMLEHTNKYVHESKKFSNHNQVKKEARYWTITYYRDNEKTPGLTVAFYDYDEKSCIFNCYTNGTLSYQKNVYPHADLSFFIAEYLQEIKSILEL